jgi:predicted Zn finger-like uncharacterized protein
MSSFDSPAGPTERSTSAGAALPDSCPTCRSSSITTTSKSPGTDSYWRCRSCGEVWNASRHQSPLNVGRRRYD